jgi:hypothetical protein
MCCNPEKNQIPHFEYSEKKEFYQSIACSKFATFPVFIALSLEYKTEID